MVQVPVRSEAPRDASVAGQRVEQRIDRSLKWGEPRVLVGQGKSGAVGGSRLATWPQGLRQISMDLAVRFMSNHTPFLWKDDIRPWL